MATAPRTRPAPEGYIWHRGALRKLPPKPAPPPPRLVPAAVAARPDKGSMPPPVPRPAATGEHQGAAKDPLPPPVKPPRRQWVSHARPALRERFWFVWCPSEAAPKYRHETKEGALGEARRLSELAPGKEFIVYAATLVESVPVVPKGGEL